MKRTPLERKTPLRRTRTMTPAAMAAQKANAQKRVYTKRGTTKKCQTCGAEFYALPSEALSRKFCSRACMGRATRKPKTCIICGAEFQPKNLHRRTCSRPCWTEAVRRSKQGKRNPQYRNGRSDGKRRWYAAKATECVVCGSAHRLMLHHVVYEQHVRKRGGDIYDPDNSLTLCRDCHMRHHAGRRLSTRFFRPENIVFAKGLLGDYASDYFARFYDDGHPLLALIG